MTADRASSLPLSVFLSPGEYFVGHARHRVHTVLCACVSITLWARQRRIGAMSHFLLAERCAAPSGRPAPLPPVPDARYGREALNLMLEALAAHGVGPQDLEARLFGGGHTAPSPGPAGMTSVGRRHGEAALDMLQDRGIPVLSCSLSGTGHRSILFDIATGDVWSRPASGTTGPQDGPLRPPAALPVAPTALESN